MDPITLGLVAAPALYSLGQSIFQRSKANKMNPQRPPAVPAAMRESTDLARQMAGSSRMAGQSFEEENIRANQASSTRAAQMAGGGPNYLAAVAGINANTNRAYGQLGMRAAQWRDRNMQMLMQNLGRVGSYQQQGAMARFNEEAGTKAALTNAANQNMYGAVSGMSAAALYGMGKFKQPTDPATLEKLRFNVNDYSQNSIIKEPSLDIPAQDYWQQPWFPQSRPPGRPW